MPTTQPKGTLYGVGVGPGDPELITLKTLRILDSCSVIAHPGKTHDSGVALQCVRPLLAGFHTKTILACEVPMTKDAETLDAAYEANAEELKKHLDAGEDVAFLNLGDPTIYGSYMILHEKLVAAGYEAHIIPGIPSFCAAAAALEKQLCYRGEELHIIPASYDLEEALKLKGTKVFMKSGKKYEELRELLQKQQANVDVVCNASMDNQICYEGVANMPPTAAYLTLVLVYDRSNDNK